MKEAYGVAPKFHRKSLELIKTCDEIVTELASQGYLLTIRQLYYQLVARNYIENSVRSYDNITTLMTNARNAGLIDWDSIEDRTRGFLQRSSWSSGSELLNICAQSYHEDWWDEQESRVFVVVEKEALAGIMENVCRQWDVPLLPARGYPSATALRDFAKNRIMRACQKIVVLHLGDHDPSGIDMSRDLEDRLGMYSRHRVRVDFRRLALNMDQVEELQPPPNPAKVTDSRYGSYRDAFGADSWELDALPPKYLHDLVEEHVIGELDFDVLEQTKARIAGVREKLSELAKNFDEE